MAKLASKDKFIDLSDYGRPIATKIAKGFMHTAITPIHITLLFGISGISAIVCIVYQNMYWAAFFLNLKSILDGADGELARLKNLPSYVGRYLYSVFDIVLNFCILMAICYTSNTSYTLTLLAFVCIQLLGTLYNYYYVILRNKSTGADTTSIVFEYKAPIAFPQEKQIWVDILYASYAILYSFFDKSIHLLDKNAHRIITFPNWFMSLVSVYGLGFQLLIIAVMLPLHLIEYIIPFFIFFSTLLFIFVGIRKLLLKPSVV